MAGATTIAYEGAIDHPDADAPWTILEREGVTGLFSSPTAIRLLMRYGEEVPRRHDLGRLERAFSAGEVLNAPAWEWLQHAVFEDRVIIAVYADLFPSGSGVEFARAGIRRRDVVRVVLLPKHRQ